jgi:hypothetical protein
LYRSINQKQINKQSKWKKQTTQQLTKF